MDWCTILASTALGVLGIAYIFWRKTDRLENLGILQPSLYQRIVNSFRLLFRRCHLVDVLDEAYKLDEKADYVGFYDISEPVILIRSPELMKSIAVKNFDHFTDHRSFLDPDLNPLFGKNLVALRGERWKEVRNLLSPAFTSSKMKSMFKLMSNCGESFADWAIEVSAKCSHYDTKELFTRYTNDVIATCAFGISVDSLRNPKNDFYVLGRDATNFSGFRGFLVVFSRFFPTLAKLLNLRFVSPKTEEFFENVVRETIETRDREGITRPDMIQLMMESRGIGSNGPSLTIQDMTAQAFIFFFGGFDSTATAMCSAAHEIAANPNVQQKLQEEIDEIQRTTNGEPTYEAINEMPYLDAVINETLRLYPIGIFIERLCVKEFELPPSLPGGKSILIHPNQNIWYPVYSVHRDPKYYPSPEVFDPERFTTGKMDVHPLAYAPFGHGPRMCIGNRFALLEIKVLLFHLLRKCHLKPSEKNAGPMRFSNDGFALQPKDGFWLHMDARDNVAK